MSGWRHADPRAKALGLWLLGAALAGLAWALPRIPQPLQYHHFADQRACLGLPNCLDTASNALFVLAGVAGLRFLHSAAGRRAFIDPREALPYALFFFATLLVGFGSGYYHLAPDNGRLVWDRAAIALTLMSWFAAILCERVSIQAGLRLLPLLIAAGLGSVAYWGWSEAHGRGDLRPYGLMQLYPTLLIPLLLRLYPPRYSGDRDILAVIGLYLLALLCDLTDRQIAALTGLFSGHTAKHAVAALAAYWVVLRLRRRHAL
ncbi:MAG TPA: alkaline phytoceramidase [Sulfuriferula sp.]|nr:alkaline phytoceramidase [Sulfuriferula sp.]